MLMSKAWSSYKDEEVLFFVRTKKRERFFNATYGNEFVDTCFPQIKKFYTISEYRNAIHYIDLNQYQIADLDSEDYNIYYSCVHNDLASIIWRCRALRNIPFAEAKDQVFRVLKFFNTFFQENNYKLLVIHIIDNYVIDIMCRVAGVYSIDVLSPLKWFAKGYYGHTLRGELNVYRQPEDCEIKELIDYFSKGGKSFRLDSLTRTKMMSYAIRMYFRQPGRYLVRNVVCAKLLQSKAYEHKFPKAYNKIRLGNFFINRYFDTATQHWIDENDSQLMLLPLHVFPEANVDYWLNDEAHSDYFSSLFEVISFFRDQGIQLVIKEHPGFIYQRATSIYRQLKQFQNVILVDPFSEASRYVERISTVLVWHGSHGVESLMQGKKVVAFDSNYYSFDYIPPYKEYQKAKALNNQQKIELAGKLLSGFSKL